MDSGKKIIIFLITGIILMAVLAVGVLLTTEQNASAALVVAVVGALIMAGNLILVRRLLCDIHSAGRLAANLAQGQPLKQIEENRFQHGQLSGLVESVYKASSVLKYEKGLKSGIIEGLPMPFLLVDTQERILFTNQICMDMLQIDTSPSEQLGKTLAEVFYNDPGRKTAVGKSITQGEVFKNLEVVITGHKGRQTHVLANVYPLYDLDDQCIGGCCIYLDMTELKDKEEEIKRQNQLISDTAAKAITISDNVASATEELSAQVEQASRGTEEQTNRIGETATSMEEMNATVLEVARNASGAAEQTDAAKAKAEEGAGVVKQSVDAIKEVQEQSRAMKENLGSLGKQSEEIGKVMTVIDDIADQTNLLALNAAIEAARAGDAGRGFAVVADEVRKLAEKTMNATKEVEKTVSSIQESTRSNMDSMDQSVQAVEKATELANSSGQALQEIVNLAQEAADQVRSIATASEEQSSASEEVNKSMEDVNRIARETADAMNQSAQAVSDLANQASELKKIIEDLNKT
ncbi:methyl-accepting chemotaxis sensory transducer with Pas/Pac sensor [Desulfonatronospira thiodismutans ASO3-1]|uniref:Methyl-accepting chemotaxis sensory transducer with Pas/Pac sensor n=1 Tax=Desulfonatronospira thiodismutans ASO3-1 TaxID=555779 RepID=D6SKD4_9BACT|nr:methyl-accepting chemotaxis protein [Desulfonatronospira thiodismutans]EFI36337.1 methyl-accepting chemotaxis sensory transducer with Pas/Pac sensor [Desulfonatronospira thiodismutans ASO3-1]